MKKMTEQLRRAKTWRERAAIAEDKQPGTPFDKLFIEARVSKMEQDLNYTGNRDHTLGMLGCWLANVILSGDSQKLHDVAKALDDWKRHKPKPDPDLIVFCNLMGMFPPGGTKHKLDPRTKRIISSGVYGPMTVEELMLALDKRFPEHMENRPRYDEAIRKKFKRYAQMFGVNLVNEREVSRKTSGHNHRKKV